MSTRIHVGTREPISRSGGLHNYIRSLAAGQSRLGHDVAVLDRVTGKGRYNIADGRQELIDTAGQSGSMVHLHFAQTALPLLRRNAWASSADIRVLHFHGPWFAEGRVQGNSIPRVAGKWLTEVLTYRRPNLRHIAASAAFRTTLHRCFGIRESRIRVVHPGVDAHRFREGDKSTARASLGLPQDVPLFVTVRRLEPRMGIDVALQALRRVPDAHLAVCGAGSLDEQLRVHAAELGVAGRVTFLGRVPDEALPAVYQAADVSLVPTVALEGFGLVVLESFACGTPVISTDSGGLVEAQGPFASEWTVPPGSVEALAGRMVEAVDGRRTAVVADAAPHLCADVQRSRTWPAASTRPC